MKLMQDQQDLMNKMSDVSNDITAAEEDILRSTDNSLDQVSLDKDCESPSPKKTKTSSPDASNMPHEINLAASTASMSSSSRGSSFRDVTKIIV